MKSVLNVLVVLCVLILLSGCSSLMKSTEDKQINLDSQVYGFKVTSFDPSTGSMSPVGEFGFGSINYRSMPVEKGQPFFAKYTVKSLWSSAPASETVIWIGRASDKGILAFEAVPEGMIKITADSVTTGSAKLEVTPVK